VNTSQFKSALYDSNIIRKLKKSNNYKLQPLSNHESAFSKRDLDSFEDHIEAYHQLIIDIMDQQYLSTNRILKGTNVRRIFVDGGFSKNSIYMNLLANAFSELEVFAASMAQATAVGTAIAIHQHWNTKPLPSDLIELKYYSIPHPTII
jgi:glycerol kinase